MESALATETGTEGESEREQERETEPKPERGHEAQPVSTAKTATGPTASAGPSKGAAGACDANRNTGRVATFMQRSDSTEFANGNLAVGLVEGGFAHQRVQFSRLRPGDNELTFTYRVKYKGVYAYDYLDHFSMTGASMTAVETRAGSGDNQVNIVRLTFDVADTAASLETAELFFSAHIASSLDHGPGMGAGSIKGSAYHVTLGSLNCKTVGSKDNQNAAKRVQYGSITIVKKAVPADGTDFDFHLAVPATGDTVAFRLDDSADGDTGSTGLPSATTYTLAPGTATISEGSLPSGWKLTGLACKGATATIDTEQRTATVPVADGADIRCTFTNTGATYRNLSVATTVEPSYVRDYDWTITKEASADRIESATGNAAFQYDVVVDASAPRDRGFALSGAIAVGNPNEVAIGGVVLASPLPGTAAAADCAIRNGGGDAVTSPVTIPAGGDDFTYACSLPDGTAADAAGTHTVRATWDSAGYPGTDGTADGTASYDFADATPMVTDGSVTVTDSAADLSALAGGNVVAAGQAPRTFRYDVGWPGVAGRCTDYANTATYTEADGGTGAASETVTLCLGADLDVTKNVVSSFDRTYLWDIDKDAAGPGTHAADPETGRVTVEYKVTVKPRTSSKDKGYRDTDWAMIGTMSVRNPNTWQAVEATVADSADIGGGAACPVVSGALAPHGAVVDASPAAGFQASIPAGKTVDFAYVCSFDSQPNYAGTNTATVTWDAARAKTPSGTDSIGTAVTLGTWGKTPVNSTVVVTDSVHDFDPAWTVVWAEGMKPQTRTYRHTWTVDRPGTCERFKNIANVSAAGNDAGPGAVLDTEDEKITACREAPLRVATTAYATFDRTYLWDIDKKLAEGQSDTVETGGDGKATVGYDVVVTSDGVLDTAFETGGTITVTNPNAYAGAAVSGTVTNAFDAGGSVCAVAGDGAIELAPGESKTLGFECGTDGANASTTGSHTATVTWAGGTRSAASKPEKVAFGVGETTDGTVDVVDDFAGTGEAAVIGTVGWDDVTSPAADWSHTFGRSIVFEGTPGTCTPHRNTATLGLESDAVGPGASADVVVCRSLGLTVGKTADATFDRQLLWSLRKDVDRSRAVIHDEEAARFDYTVSAVPDGHIDANHRVSGVITLANHNTFERGALMATVTDTIDIDGVSCAIDARDADGAAGLQVNVPARAGESGGTVELAYACTGKPKDSDYRGANTVDVAWAGGTATATAAVAYQRDGLSDQTVRVFDDMARTTNAPALLGEAVWNERNEATDFTYTLPLPGAPGTCVNHTNTAWIALAEGNGAEDPASSRNVSVCLEDDLMVTQTAVAKFDRTYLWDIDKSVDAAKAEAGEDGKHSFRYAVGAVPDGFRDGGWALRGTIALTNPNSYAEGAITASVADMAQVGRDVECDVEGGASVAVRPGTTKVLEYACGFGAKPDYRGTNTVVVDWGRGRLESRSPVTFELDDAYDRDVEVFDDMGGGEPRLLGSASWNDAGERREFAYDLELEGAAGTCETFANTAFIRLRSPQGPGNGVPTPDPTAVRTVELCAEAPLRVEKTAEAVFDRQYLWELGKTAARGRVETAAGTPAVAEYSVEATPAGHRDSAWRISGDITVRNPNDYKDVLATVTDGAGMGASADCTVDGGGSVPVAAGAAVTLAYECVFADEPGRSGKSIATAQWRAHDGGEAAAVATAGVEFQVGTETDRTVTVLDHLAERDAEVGAAKARDAEPRVAGPRVLGTARWNADRTPARFDYSVELDGTGGTCTAFSNVASLRETGQTASADVHVCAEAAPDARLEVRGVLERTYLWNIDKSADAKTVMVGSGNKGAAYTVTVTPNGHADSGWALEGTVAVRNPNDYTPMAVALGVGLALDPDVEPDPARGSEAGAACEVGAGDTGTIVVAPGKTVVLPVVCDLAGEPPAGHAGTAVLAWTDALGAERETTARAGVVFSVDTERHATVTIGDDQGDPDAEARILGTADWNAEGTPAVFEYPLRVAAPVGKCLEHTNTATIVETADSASAVVRFCGAAAPLVPLEPLPSVVPAGGHLPDTGAEVRAIAWAGLALLLAGILALGAGRRRSLQT
ncbi:prealbumin-like fold domain-containing protein [Arthrobacter sp. KK5.5]|uniref:prealbumin-like fold domain-containing protein n=1 Tax=Arthrobacter sp. KK5.5 TaxID=3373084 RepID=UPI003EE447DA